MGRVSQRLVAPQAGEGLGVIDLEGGGEGLTPATSAATREAVTSARGTSAGSTAGSTTAGTTATIAAVSATASGTATARKVAWSSLRLPDEINSQFFGVFGAALAALVVLLALGPDVRTAHEELVVIPDVFLLLGGDLLVDLASRYAGVQLSGLLGQLGHVGVQKDLLGLGLLGLSLGILGLGILLLGLSNGLTGLLVVELRNALGGTP